MLRHGIPPRSRTALRAVSAALPRLGLRRRRSRGRSPTASELKLRDRTLRGAAPARPQPVGHRLLGRASADPARRRPPDQAHLLQPAARAPARTAEPDVAATAPAGAASPTSSRCAQTREMAGALVLPGHGEPITDHVALIDERFRLHAAARAKIHGLIAERPRTAYEIAQRDVGQRRRHPGLPDALRGARPRRPAARRRARRRGASDDGVVRFESLAQPGD